MADTIYRVCLLRKYNNYFNRIIKGFSSFSEYLEEIDDEDLFLYDKPINFSFEDNVSTELIINDCPFAADYLLLLEQVGTALKINSRWFVMEEIYTRNKQRKYSLRRDVIFDFKEQIANSPAFIQKAMLENSDPFIFNSEGMSFNQIKREETLLKDKTKFAWIVGYIAKNAAPSDITITTASSDFKPTYIADIATEMGITEADLAALLNFDGLQNQPTLFTYDIGFNYYTLDDRAYYRSKILYNEDFSENLTKDFSFESAGIETQLFVNDGVQTFNLIRETLDIVSESIEAHKTSLLSSLSTIFGRTFLPQNSLETLRKYEGNNTVIFYNGEYYRLNIVVENSSEGTNTGYKTYTTWSAVKTMIESAASNLPSDVSLYTDGKIALFSNSVKTFLMMEKVSIEEGIIPSITTKISSARNKVISQNFDMFAIPFGSVLIRDSGGNYRANSLNAINIASTIAAELDSACYDIQLLPYCPILDLMDSGGAIDIRNASENVDFNYINNSSGRIRESEYVQCTGQADAGSGTGYAAVASVTVDEASTDIVDEGYIRGAGAGFENATVTKTVIDSSHTRLDFWAEVSSISAGNSITLYIWWETAGTVHESIILWSKNNSFSVVLNYPLTNRDETKIESECNKYRLVSPNYQGAFDFNVAKNGGSVKYFIADCTYRPYTPYIKVAPEFNYLYGTNFGDCRGLICGGDYSLPRFTSAWETYELNNKNYQNIFNRDIQHLDFEQSLEMRQQLITGGLGILTSGAVGAAAGAKAGGLGGAIAGAAIGTLGSAAGYALDIDMMGQRHKEAKDYAIDKYNYQLGNIKALPYTLTKVSAFNINSKIWPFLEFYTCTDEEKEALRNKIEFESMTVMRVGYIRDYLKTERHYLKCEMIRNEEIAEDNHIFEAIYNELLKGVFI